MDKYRMTLTLADENDKTRARGERD